MKILSFTKPWEKTVEVDGLIWEFPYRILGLVEFTSSFIISFSWSELEKNLPYEGFYFGCTVWCYNKKDQTIKWVIEEPPEWFDKDGNSEGKLRGFSSDPRNRNQRIDELYMSLRCDERDDKIYVSTTAAREFELNPRNGKVKLYRTGLR